VKEKKEQKGTLYVVATPIGNLEDMTLRAIRILKEVSLIAAEDTRRTKTLLNAYEIKTPLISLYDQTERSRSRLLISRLEEGRDVAYVSDAGTPGISDPGYILVNRAYDAGVRVVPVPGASAVIAALSIAGLPMDRFVFVGFPPARSSRRRPLLESLKNETGTLVFYESPRRLPDLLRDVGDVFGNREMVLTRELTKMFEDVRRGPIRDILASLEGREVKGEVTLIVAGKDKAAPPTSPEDIASEVLELQKEAGISMKDMVGRITDRTGLPRRQVYREVLKLLGKSAGNDEGENP